MQPAGRRKALVTGGDSGIGRAAAIAYAREGADIALNYLPEEQSDAEEVARLVEAEGRNIVLLPGDLSDEEFCKNLIHDALEKLGGLDILALVAGKQVATEDIQDITTEQLVKTFEVNVFSLFWIAKAVLPHLKPGASIITCSSIQAYQPGKNLIDYASTRPPSLPSAAPWPNRWPPKASESTSWLPAPSGHPCR